MTWRTLYVFSFAILLEVNLYYLSDKFDLSFCFFMEEYSEDKCFINEISPSKRLVKFDSAVSSFYSAPKV